MRVRSFPHLYDGYAVCRCLPAVQYLVLPAGDKVLLSVIVMLSQLVNELLP